MTHRVEQPGAMPERDPEGESGSIQCFYQFTGEVLGGVIKVVNADLASDAHWVSAIRVGKGDENSGAIGRLAIARVGDLSQRNRRLFVSCFFLFFRGGGYNARLTAICTGITVFCGEIWRGFEGSKMASVSSRLETKFRAVLSAVITFVDKRDQPQLSTSRAALNDAAM
ncbi:hypothetical protein FHS27_003457 [Rhodopirellula rubra]|uniref:Uncharacterized protein n=1 Tax=Aporhodopirellula rubra TaxID=980271 RepID=A0A7W5E1K6_9BACT|nr:hypothetical protein [Aporhodopirellula rubra]MBB3207632.1 hypothetical protein [Aporhodopirellula rubra]